MNEDGWKEGRKGERLKKEKNRLEENTMKVSKQKK